MHGICFQPLLLSNNISLHIRFSLFSSFSPHTIALSGVFSLSLLFLTFLQLLHTLILLITLLNPLQPPLNLAPSFLLIFSIPRNPAQKATHTFSHTTQRTAYTTDHIALTELTNAVADAAGDAANSVVSTFAYVTNDAADRAADSVAQASETVADGVSDAFAYACYCVACGGVSRGVQTYMTSAYRRSEVRA